MNLEDDLHRLTRPDLLDGVEDWPVADVRELRDACRDLEGRVSYQRRVLQGRLDIALAERERRKTGGDLVEALPGILADRPTTGPRIDRSVGVLEDVDGDLDDLDGDAQLPGGRPQFSMTELPDLSSEQLTSFIESLALQERQLSEQRRALLDNLDRLQAELVVRYRDGRAEIGQIVDPTTGTQS